MQINIEHVSVVLNNQKLLDDINLCMKENENWAITGQSGAGKTTLVKAIAKLLFHHGDIQFTPTINNELEIAFIAQQHQFKNKDNIQLFYHQQRFNSCDTEETLTVREMLDFKEDNLQHNWISFFGIEHLMNKPMIQLSNGENKRLQLIKALNHNPGLLILDNPFVGLDKDGRALLQEALHQLCSLGKKIIIVCHPNDIPKCITHVAHLHQGKLLVHGPKESIKNEIKISLLETVSTTTSTIIECYQSSDCDFEIAVALKDVTIQYNQKIILHQINWVVKKGEKWCLSGPNGSGKSTLLSLITADNPQAFANKIWLFDKKKGSGESIWDIKKRIGHVSPELHLFFEKGIEVKDAIGSGLFDTIGLFKRLSALQESIVENWMTRMGISHLQSKRLHQLSLGEQRLVMLARALVKSPPLIILDEPCQGLDDIQSENFKQIIEEICASKDVTLIYVSHYQNDIPTSIDKFLYLENGRVKAQS